MIALLAIVVLGGLGRLLSMSQLSLPDDPSGVAIVFVGLLAEVVISPIMLWWLVAKHRPAG